MKKIIAFITLAVCAFSASSAGNDIVFTKRNAADTAQGPLTPAHPTTAPGLMYYDHSTLLPGYLYLGQSLSITGGVIDVASGPSVTWSTLSGKPGWTSVFDGSYASLTSSPTLGTAAALNVPASGNASTGQVVKGDDTRLSDSRTPTAHNQAFSTITSTPTTLAGYGIADAYPLTGNPSGFLTGITSGQVTSALGFTPYDASNPNNFVTSASLSSTLASYPTSAAMTTALSGKMNNPGGTTAQYVRGDASLATFPTIPTVPTAVSAFTNDAGYVNQAGARAAISLTTTGTGGAASYNSTTGVLNVPNYAASAGTVTSVAVTSSNLTVAGSPVTSSGSIAISLPSTGTAGTYNGSVTTDAQGRVTAATSIVVNDSPGRTLVTSTSATGYQISSTRLAQACYEGSFATTSTIGGPASGSVFLETADTNSTTPGDWTIKASQTYSNTITLAVVLNQVQANNWTICRMIPAGKFVRLRSTVSGTASVSVNTQQQENLF